MVTMKPPGSRPGVTSFAIIPTTNPNTIQDRMPIELSSLLGGRCASRSPTKERPADHAFVSQEPLLAVESATVARQRPIGPDDPMAGDDDGDGVGAVCRTHGANRGGLADA